MERLLITGANRGIGLALVDEGLRRGHLVIATCRDPGAARELQQLARQHGKRLLVLPLDVTDEASIVAARDQVASQLGGVDVLLNNAGVFPRGERPDNLEAETLLRTLHVNAVGPMMVVKHFLDLLRESPRPRVINVSSQMGSLTRKLSGRAYSYSSSKATLNMLSRALAWDLQPEGVIVIALHPGWVVTDMGGDHAAVLPGESARGILDVAERLTPEQTGKFLSWDGREMPW